MKRNDRGEVLADQAADPGLGGAAVAVAVHPQDQSPDVPRRTVAAAGVFYRWWLVPLALVVGALLRTREWLFGKSLWLDELTITTNLAERDFAGLVEPLGGNQGAPIGWLWAERVAIQVFGISELPLRLVPWIASLVALAIFPLVSRKLIGDVATPAAVVLFATSPTLIFYAAETKQYSSDVACALVAILLTMQLSDRKPVLRTALRWGLVCAVLVWCSQPTILVSAACGVFLLCRFGRDRAALMRLAAGGAVLALSVGVQWLLVLRNLDSNEALKEYWQAFKGFPPIPPTLGGHIAWLPTAADAFVHQVGQWAGLWPAICVAVWGLATLVRRRPWSALLVVLIVAVAVAAALTYRYPMAQRLALYLLPVAILLLCSGIDDASSDARGRLRAPWRQVAVTLSVAGLVVVTGASVVTGIGKFTDPDETTAGREAVAFVAAHQEPGDVILAEEYATSTMMFYGPGMDVFSDGAFSFEPAESCDDDPLAAFAGSQRLWMVFAHQLSNQPANRTEIYLSQVAAKGRLVMGFTGAGDAGAYLFDLRQPPGPPETPLTSWVRNGCFTVTR